MSFFYDLNLYSVKPIIKQETTMYKSSGYILILFIFLSLKVNSEEVEVYKTIKPNGEATYTDQASQQAEKVTIIPQNTVNLTLKKPISTQKRIIETIKYEVKITTPANNATIRDNQGNVNIQATVSPHLTDYHQFSIELDGITYGSPQSLPHFKLNNVSRGAHSIKVTLSNKEGKVIASSPQSTFYLHRASIN